MHRLHEPCAAGLVTPPVHSTPSPTRHTPTARPPRQLSLHFFPGEPLLMSAAADNSIKHWVFDSAEAAPRLLRFRAGHHAPPTVIKHYGQVGAGEG